MDPTTIILGIIFFLIIAIIIVFVFFYNRELPPTALITDFGLTIQNVNSSLYMTMENIDVPMGSTGQFQSFNIFPVMSTKAILPGNDPEPTEGWILERPNNGPTGMVVTFFNSSNSGYVNYSVSSDGTRIDPPYIAMNARSPPSPPIDSTSAVPANIGWFMMEQTVVNEKTVTAFRSLYPANQYLIPLATNGAFPGNADIILVTIGVPTNGNNLWLVGSG